MLHDYTLRIPLNHLGDRTSADEIQEKIGGKEVYVFGSTDAKSRFLLSQDISDRKEGADVIWMVKQSIERAGKKPVEFATDKLRSYGVGIQSIACPKERTLFIVPTLQIRTRLQHPNQDQKTDTPAPKMQIQTTARTATRTGNAYTLMMPE